MTERRLFKWIMGGAAAAGLIIVGALFSKIDSLEKSYARNGAILDRIEAKLGLK